MRRNGLPGVLLALAACTADGRIPGDTGELARNGVAVGFAIDEVPDTLDTLDVRVVEVVLEGEGPSGSASVSTEVGATLPLLGGVLQDFGLELEVGSWRDVRVTMVLGASGDVPALAASGVVEDRNVSLAIAPELVLEGRGKFELGAGIDPAIRFELEPEDWFDDLGEGDDDDDDHEPIVVSPDGDRELYDAVVKRILASVEVRFPGEADEDDEEREGGR